MKLKVKEQDVLNATIQYLNYRRIKHVHVRNTGAIIHKGGNVYFARPKNKQVGAPDIIGNYHGKAFAIELKSSVGRVRPEQDVWLREWADDDGVYCVARSLDHVEQFFESIDETIKMEAKYGT